MENERILVLVAPSGAEIPDLLALAEIERLAGSPPRWLDRRRAVELAFPGADDPARRQALAELLAAAPVDHALLPAGGRRKRLLLCDMDSTVVTIECIDELAAHAGIRERVAEITRRAMAGEIEFERAVTERVALLAGVPVRVVDEICRERLRLQPGARTLVRTMQAHGAFCALVSGGFREFTHYVRILAGFDADYANTLEVRDGILTGRLVPPVLGPRAKLDTLRHLARARGLEPSQTLAIGDGANDADMVREAGLGVAYRAHEVLRRVADARIDHTDLTAALHFQGYAREEFAPADEDA